MLRRPDLQNVDKNANRYANNGGGSSTMKKKVGGRFARISSGGSFSINGGGNHNYIGNPNNANAYVGCRNNLDLSVKTSVKNTKGLLQSRCNPVNSFSCYKNVNQELVDKFEEDGVGFNKHFRSENKDSSSKVEKAKCVVDRSNYKEEIEAAAADGVNKDCKKCDITKDLAAVNAYVPGYDVYMLKKKKGCAKNPPDAKVIAC